MSAFSSAALPPAATARRGSIWPGIAFQEVTWFREEMGAGWEQGGCAGGAGVPQAQGKAHLWPGWTAELGQWLGAGG